MDLTFNHSSERMGLYLKRGKQNATILLFTQIVKNIGNENLKVKLRAELIADQMSSYTKIHKMQIVK